MDEQISNGAQFLVIKDNSYKKVTAFHEFAIDIDDLTCTSLDEKFFLESKKVGFILTNVDEQSATIKILNHEGGEIKILFNEKKELIINDTKYIFELLAIRFNADKWYNWKISFVASAN